MRRRTFRGRRRTPAFLKRQRFWIGQTIGGDDANGNRSCPLDFPGGPGSQNFEAIAVEAQYGGYDPQNPTEAPFRKDKIVVKRSIGKVHLFGVGAAEATDPGRAVAWAICRLDSESVNDPAYAFPSLFYTPGIGMPMQERVLQFGISHARTIIATQSFGTQYQRYDDIEWDLKPNMNLHTGDSLWLVLEEDFCWQSPGGQTALLYHGWTRTLCQE